MASNPSNVVTNPDVKLAFDALVKKRKKYSRLFDYYRGYHPLKYSSSRLKDTFENLDSYFAQNWISVIVDAVLDRMNIKGFDISSAIGGESLDDIDLQLDEIMKQSAVHIVADNVHESSTVTGEGFLIALQSDEGDTPFDIYHNDSRTCHMFYEEARPNVKRVAAKIWRGEDKKIHLALYYTDRFEYYISRGTVKTASSWISSASEFIPDPEVPEEPNELGIIPVFHFDSSKASKKLDLGPSEISLQDAINKLLADMMVSSEFSAFVQRIIISQSDPGNLQNKPGANWWISAGDGKGQQAEVLEFGGRALSPFLEAIDKLATSLAIISRTPKHYFFSQGGDPSGEALLAMEAPLNKKVNKRKSLYEVEWQAFAFYILKAMGIENIKRTQIITLWEPAETTQPKTQADTVAVEVGSGIPLITSLRRKGWTKEDIVQMESDKKAENESMSGLARNALAKMRGKDASDDRRSMVDNEIGDADGA